MAGKLDFCLKLVSILPEPFPTTTDLFYVNACSTFKDLFASVIVTSVATNTTTWYLYDSSIPYTVFVNTVTAYDLQEEKIPRASSTCPDRSEPSGNVKDTISLNLGNLTYIVSMSLASLKIEPKPPHTLSKITRGPLTPPTVLYRILGWTVVMRGSCTSLAIMMSQ